MATKHQINGPKRSKSREKKQPDASSQSESDRDADVVDEAASDEPVRHMQGLKLIKEALRLEDFPMTKADIDYTVGDIDVEDGHGGFIPVFQLTERFTQQQFDSPEQVIHALKEARKGYGKTAA